MWIKSQDGEALVQANRLEVIDNKVCEFIDANQSINLGEYESKGRAKRVLLEIRDCIIDEYKYFEMPQQ